jgi:hypothetical protein
MIVGIRGAVSAQACGSLKLHLDRFKSLPRDYDAAGGTIAILPAIALLSINSCA